MKKILLTLLVGMFVFANAAFAADITTATLTVGSGTGAAGDTVSLPITIGGTTGKAGGVAFTFDYDKTKVTFEGIKAVSTLFAKDPLADYCQGDLTKCTNPYDNDAPTTSAALFYQVNESSAMVAAASAFVLSDGVLFNAEFTIASTATVGDVYNISVKKSSITNADAGYATATEIPILVGMPATTATDGYYPVADNFTTTPTAGKITVESPAEPGDVTGTTGEPDGKVDVNDILMVIDFAFGAKTPTDDQMAAADIAVPEGTINVNDILAVIDLAFASK